MLGLSFYVFIMDNLNNFVIYQLNYRKICLLEKPSAKAVLPANKTFISSTEDVGKVSCSFHNSEDEAS